jgi:hypothetical protein
MADATVDTTVAKPLTYTNVNLIDALTQMAEAWECEWWMEDSIIRFGRCEYGTSVDFEMGVNVGEMSRQDSRTKYATRIYAFGSTRNLTSDYRPVDGDVVVNGVVQTRLMLPEEVPYVDAYPGMSTEEAIEEVVVFDDVYPHRVGVMTGITTHEYTDEEGVWNAYRFKDAGLTFSKKYVLPGQDLKIRFQSGSMNGMMFSVIFNPYDESKGETQQPEQLEDGTWNALAQVFEIKRNEDNVIPLPSDDFHPNEGDQYVLEGFDSTFVSDTMLPAAEQELLEKAKRYVEKSKIDPSTYTCKMMPEYMYNDGEPRIFEPGDRVNLINQAYFKDGRQSRIIGYEYALDIPHDHPTYVIGETAPYSRMGAIEGKVDALTYKGQAYTGTGSGGASVYIIGVNDVTNPSSRNVYSALRSMQEFLSRKKDDTASGLITFLQGLVAKELMQADKGLHAGTYSQGSTGAAIYQDEAGNWHVEADYLDVRMRLRANEVEIQRTTHIGGAQMKTAAAMTCIDV